MTMFTLYLTLVFLAVLAIFIVLDIKRDKKNSLHIGNKPKYKLRTTLIAYMFLIPALILIVMFVFQPILMNIWYGFTDYYLLDPENINYIGLENFENVFKQFDLGGDIYHAFKNTIQFMVFVVPLQVGIALTLALILNQKRKGNTYFKVAYFAPVVMSLTIISILWKNILMPTDSGLMNNMLALIGVETQTFLLNPNQAMNLIVFISAWQGAGFQMLIFLAGLKTIPNDLYEAAKVDGASSFERFVYITLPGLRPVMLFVLLTTFIGASKLMIQPMVMTGYKVYTVTLSYLIYLEGYKFRQVGSASAMALIVTIFIASLILIQKRLLREDN